MSPFRYYLFSTIAGLLANSAYAQQPVQNMHTVQGIGYVEPSSEIRRLAFKHPGILGKYEVQIGDKVKIDALLASQKNEEEDIAVSVAKSQLDVANANLQKTLAGVNPYEIEAKKSAQRFAVLDAEYAERKLARIGRLQSNQFASEDERDLAETTSKLKHADSQRLTSEARYLSHFVREVDQKVAEAQVKVAEAKVREAEQVLEETKLKSPINGTILEVLLRAGESTYTAGSPEPVLLIGDLDHLRVRAEVDENYARVLKEGLTATLFGRGLGDQSIPGKVVLVKKLMGKKTVFSKTATERKDIDVIQAFIEPTAAFIAPVGLEVNVKIDIDSTQK